MSNHEVVLDTAGTGGWPRLTCSTCNNTCLKAPYMSGLEWPRKVARWLRVHPPKDSLGMTFGIWVVNSSGEPQHFTVMADGMTFFRRRGFPKAKLANTTDGCRVTFYIDRCRGENFYAAARLVDEKHDKERPKDES